MDDVKLKITTLRRRLVDLDNERNHLLEQLAALEQAQKSTCSAAAITPSPLTHSSPVSQKVGLFRLLFTGRQDVFAVRWANPKSGRSGYAPACANEWVKGTCGKPQVKCGECPHQAFTPMSDEVIESHLRGESRSRGSDFVVGIYPLLPDDSCSFLAVDFDGDGWAADALAYVETCRAKNVPAVLERSRSGNGGHVWIFFTQPVPAHDARQLGALLLTETRRRSSVRCRAQLKWSLRTKFMSIETHYRRLS